jgi:phosphoribosyl 1,2-cyclic phosphodiesterase
VRITVWGCRGSLAAPGKDTVIYGGNTSCVEVRTDDGTLIILDAGTGMRALGERLQREPVTQIHLLLTHLHLDHLEGLGFFLPIWERETTMHIWGPASVTRSLDERISRYLSPPLFPIDLSDIPAELVFHDVPDEPWELGGLTIRAELVSHPGPTLGYRFDGAGGSFAYIPDHEPAIGVELERLPPDWIPGRALAAEVDVLLHDSQFTEEEYRTRVGWGHSSVADAVTFARKAAARRLVLFHHDPWREDEELTRLAERAGELWDGAGGPPPQAAREGMEIDLRASDVELAADGGGAP